MEQQGAHEGGGRAWGGRRAPLPRGLLVCFLTYGPSLLDHVRREKHVSEGFIPFDIPFLRNPKTGKKNSNSGLGLWLIG